MKSTPSAEELCMAYSANSAAIAECGAGIRKDGQCPGVSGESISCLREYYEASRGSNRESEKDTPEWKAVLECPECLACHGWVEKRRQLKRQRGILRRQITGLGRRLKNLTLTPTK